MPTVPAVALISEAKALAVPTLEVFPAPSMIVAVMTADGATSNAIPNAMFTVVKVTETAVSLLT